MIDFKSLFTHIIFWPVTTVSIMMNIWLFSSFPSALVYQIFGGIIGAAVDLFKLRSLFYFSDGYKNFKRRKKTLNFPFKFLIYYLFFMFVSAGASLLFGLIDIDRSIQNQHITDSGINKKTIEREIKNLERNIDDLYNFDTFNKMSENLTKNTNKAYVWSFNHNNKKKEENRRKARELEKELAEKEKLLDSIIINSSGTFEVFDYLSAFLPGDKSSNRNAKIFFLILIIIVIELLTEECRGALEVFKNKKRTKSKKKVNNKHNEKHNEKHSEKPRLKVQYFKENSANLK